MGELVNGSFTLEQLYLSIFLLLYFGLLLGVRTAILYRKTGFNPMKKFGGKSEHQLPEVLITIAIILLVIIAGNYFFLMENVKYLIPFKFMDYSWIQGVGLTISAVGLVTAFLAQMQMKESWRISLDNENDIELVDRGLFAYTRNPIYIALIVAYIGLFLVLPSLFSFLFLLIMWIGISLKVKDEEKFLESKLGQSYMDYKKKVNRWI